MQERDILQDQIDYYRARAGEYDEWWFRHGRYDRGAEFNARWHAEVYMVERAVDEWLARQCPDNVLELACGTGLFTRRIAPRAGRVTCVDASPEVLAINRARVAAANVAYFEADIFEWRPRERYDAIFFSFWLSHVPDARLAQFWANVGTALTPNGAVYLIDSAYDPTSSAKDHVLPGRAEGVATRKLNDGREYRIVKYYWDPRLLAERLSGLGWSASIAQTANYFIYGEARPASRGGLLAPAP